MNGVIEVSRTDVLYVRAAYDAFGASILSD